MVALPLLPAAGFALITRPDVRGRWMLADRIEVDTNDRAVVGRIEPGAVYHCHHGKEIIDFEIVDWRPGEYVTMRYRLPLGLSTSGNRSAWLDLYPTLV